MKTSRMKRIFMMAMAAVVLALLRIFRKFTKLRTFPQIDAGTEPHAVPETEPERMSIKPELEVDGEHVSEYNRAEPIYFEPDAPYSELEGIVTFRGDNLRKGGSYGTAQITKARFSREPWQVATGKLKKSYGKGYWTGSGWTGQPLIVRWPEKLRESMNIYDDKKAKTDLTEIVYSTMDGKAYFLDLEDGTPTRDTVSLEMPFKGAGALDPRGYMAFFGAGDAGPEKPACCAFVSLIDGSTLFELGAQDPFSLRKFHGYDSSPLVDVKTDTLIEPGENGILYTLKLNTHFDAEKKTLTIDPTERVKLRYKTARSSEESYWLGMEDSAVIWKNYIYIADNGGTLLCIDINTMKVVWSQDVADDTNGSPVFALEDGVPYLYIATSLHWKASRVFRLADVPIFKINAITGEYVWIRTYFCNTIAGISGGIQATCVCGRGAIDDLVIFPVARTPQVRAGLLVALDKKTGKEVWRLKMKRYAWSSPVAVYAQDGKAYIVLCASSGELMLVDARTGKLLDEMSLGANIEATPAVYENTVVVGTRGEKIFGITIE